MRKGRSVKKQRSLGYLDYHKAVSCSFYGNPRSAIDHFDKAFKLYPKLRELDYMKFVNYAKGYSYEQSGEYLKAIKYYAKVPKQFTKTGFRESVIKFKKKIFGKNIEKW